MTHATEHCHRPWWKRWPLWFIVIAAVLLLGVAAIERIDKPAGAMPVERNTPQGYGLAYREVAIPTENGKHLLGWFIPAAVAVLHGWGSNAGMMLPLAPSLHRAGYAVLLFDARNHGQSDGDGATPSGKSAARCCWCTAVTTTPCRLRMPRPSTRSALASMYGW